MIELSEYSKKQLVFVFSSEGEKISFRNDNIVVKSAEGEIKHQSTCWRIAALFVVGQITITSGLIDRSHKFCFPIFLMKQSMRTYDVIGFKALGNTRLRLQQYQYHGMEIAKHLTANKIENQRRALMKQRYRGEETNEVIKRLKLYQEKVYEVDSIQSLMGIEGGAAKAYFAKHFINCDWNGRQPRAKRDYINATLDLGYSLLFNFIESLLYFFGFDVYVGVMHREFYMRKSLVCDLVEPFRPMVDLCIKNAISRNQCCSDHFNQRNGSYRLDWARNKEYILFLLKPLIKNKDLMFKYIRDYYRSFSLQRAISDYPYYKLV